MRKTYVVAAVFVLAALLLPGLAHAATGGGGGLPWDTGLQTVEREMTGPVPFMIGMVGFGVGLCMLVFGHEMNSFAKTLIFLLFAVSAACAAPTMAAALGIAGALVG
jgi:type IV secretory pathway VirB2 component (pilin)